ncbi:hypothetical protein FA13DRAFT_263441 [Coprinellus micaceus]|uniref:Uncharacterized protein n=1 Tax=Coprinellus micaceus TaxID=71717 RepID=A0A4Y7SGC6_COPMI|nr:hypothetical protein FA13DRAFT_263441 [Coprinellus micaceus]
MSAQRPRTGITEVPGRSFVFQAAACWLPVLQPSSDWQRVEEPAAFNNTITSTSGVGATAEIEFEGTGIEVYGSIAQSGIGNAPSSAYIVDERGVATYTASQSDANQTKILFYSSNALTPGKTQASCEK